MHFPRNQELQFTNINADQSLPEDNNNDSIINQLNLLDNGCTFESRVVKVESFIYAQETKVSETPYQRLHDSFLHDPEGNIIPPISNRKISSYNLTNSPSHKHPKIPQRNGELRPNAIHLNQKAEERIRGKKSIREEIMQENQLLERRLSLNKNYVASFPSTRHYNNLFKDPNNGYCATTKEFPKESPKVELKDNEETLTAKMDDEILVKLEEQYNKSKVIKLYNFIMKQVPLCHYCNGYRTHLSKFSNGVTLNCKDCDQQNAIHHPLIGILYDLENKSRFEEEIAAYQTILDKITHEIDAFREQIGSLQALKDRLISLKNLNRKKYKEINESKFYLKKHLGNLQQSHLNELEKLIPKEYLEQMQMWSDIKQNYKSFLKGSLSQIYKIMPVHLHEQLNSKFISNLHKILNYQKEQSVKISISQHIKFPIKKIDSAVFVVDGSYNLPVFQNIKHLHLQFQNKKTLRQLNLLFTNFPREIYALSFTYNHKIHSHISAQTFPFLKYVSAFPSIKKMQITVENMKDFEDVTEMCFAMTPKLELSLTVTKHIFSKGSLNLPQNYYVNLISKLGSSITKLEIDLPESADSPAIINYDQLISLKYLSVFKLSRGEKSKDFKKTKILESLNSSFEDKKKMLIFKRLLASRVNFLRIIKKQTTNASKDSLQSVLAFLL